VTGRNGALSFGVNEFMRDYHDSEDLLVTNHGSSTATFSVASTQVGGVPHTLHLNRSSLAVGPHSQADIRLTLTVPTATAGATHDAFGNDAFQEVAGHITLTPTDASSNHGVTLQLPYYMVPRARSNVSAARRGNRIPVLRLQNVGGALAGNGDFYAWGLKNAATGAVASGFEPRAIGVQSNPISATNSVLVFAVNTYGRVSTMAAGEYDIYIDVNGDGVWDYVLFMADIGVVTAGGIANGQAGTFLLNLSTGALTQEFLADAPTDGSTVLIPVFASDLGITPTNPRLTYAVNAFDSSGGSESVPGTASFNAFTPSVANAMFVSVPPNGQVDVPVWVDPVEFALTPALGFMVVTEDNGSGAAQANLLRVSGGN
jgi:minor extracellular serine protease Vpr